MVCGRHEIILGIRAALAEHYAAGGIAGRRLARGMQGLEKRDQGSCFRWTQVLSVSRHVAASLDYLPDQLVLCQPHRDSVKCWPSFAAQVPKRMAVAALLDLEDQRTLPLKRSRAVQELL